MDIASQIEKLEIGKMLKNQYLSDYTTYKVGGIAKIVVYPKDIESLKKLIKLLKSEEVKHKILGNGSNVIFNDAIYDGVIIKLDEFKSFEINDNEVFVGAGYDLMKLSVKLSKMGLSGLEFAAGIPGTLGGAVVTNAGAYLKQISDVIKEITVLTPDLELKKLTNEELSFSYRKSFFMYNPGYICLNVSLTVEEKDSRELMNLINDRKKRRMDSQPLEYPSAGAVFRNPKDMHAGKLIEDIGLKGYSIGGAEVSEKHANYIINKNNATASDVINLINFVRDRVNEEYNMELKIEQEFVE